MIKWRKWGSVLCWTLGLTVGLDCIIRLMIFLLPDIVMKFNSALGEVLQPLQRADITFGWPVAIPGSLLAGIYAAFTKHTKGRKYLCMTVFLLILWTGTVCVTCLNGIPVFAVGKVVLLLL